MADDMRMPQGRPTYVSGGNMGGMQQSPMEPMGKKSNKMMWIVVAVIVVVLVVLGVLFRDKIMGTASTGGVKGATTGKYQAVFLTNGQVYFGHLADVNDSYVTLSDIFYLQVTPLQGAGAQTGQTQSQQQQQLSLVKLGNELHGPVDSMKINRDQILFFEDLKDDGKVVDAIKQYKANPNASGTQPAPATNTQVTPPPANTK